MKLHLNLGTRDLDASIAFYQTLLGAAPVKTLPDYALFITERPGLELALDLDLDPDVAADGTPGVHYGIATERVEDVEAQIARLDAAGYATDVEREDTCCYAVQTKVWASDPEGRRWETYVVHAESEERDNDETTCCA